MEYRDLTTQQIMNWFSTRGGGGVNTDFQILVDTTKAGSDPDTMVIPTLGAGYDCTVDWGDDTTDSYSGTAPTISHTYAVGGEKVIKISGDFPRCYFNYTGDKLKLLEVQNWGAYGVGITNQTSAFNGCSNLSQIAEDFKNINDVLINGMNMFRLCSSLTALPANMTLDVLEEAGSMFDRTNLVSLPTAMTCTNLADGRYMFDNSGISVIPSKIVLENLTDGFRMFGQLGAITILSDMNLAKLTLGGGMFLSTTVDTEDYSNILIRIEANNVNTDVFFGGGDSKYNADGKDARDQLTLPVEDGGQGWTISDGGLES